MNVANIWYVLNKSFNTHYTPGRLPYFTESSQSPRDRWTTLLLLMRRLSSGRLTNLLVSRQLINFFFHSLMWQGDILLENRLPHNVKTGLCSRAFASVQGVIIQTPSRGWGLVVAAASQALSEGSSVMLSRYRLSPALQFWNIIALTANHCEETSMD